MPPRSYIHLIVALIGAALLPLLLTAALLAPTPRRYDLGTPGDAYVVRNFYGPEGAAAESFRWSGPDAALLIPDPYAGAAALTARLHGNPDLSPIALYAGTSAERVMRIEPTAGWRIYRVLAPRSQLWGADGQPAEVHLAGEPGAARPEDPRELGVAIDYLRVQPLAGAPAPLAAPLAEALLLSWGLALLVGAFWLAARALVPRDGAYALDLAMLAYAALLAAGLALWAWRDADSLRWAIPLQWPWLGAASLALLALWAAARSVGRPAAGAERLEPARPQSMPPAPARALLRAPRAPARAAWSLPRVGAIGRSARPSHARRPPARARPRPSAGALATVGVTALAHLLLLLPLGASVRGLAALVILGLPGGLLARLLLRDEPDRLVQIFFGLCGALALPVLLLMALQLAPGPPPPWLLLLLCDAQSALVGWALLRRRAVPRHSRPAAVPQGEGAGLSTDGAGAGRPSSGERDREGAPQRDAANLQDAGGGTGGAPAHPLLPLGLIMLLGAALRLPFLGRAELHDDEATAVVAAARLVAGQADQLLVQLKGPAQALLPAGPMLLTGQISELVARAPFALAGLGVILGGYLLARRMLAQLPGATVPAPDAGRRASDDGRAAPQAAPQPAAGAREAAPGAAGATAALIVALILALDGFLIAFSRTVQYQSIVMVMGLGAALCCWRFYQGLGRPLPQLVAAAILMAVALLGHYDAIYAAPALAWLVLAGGRRRGWRPGAWLRGLAPPLAVGAALLGSFYVPFVLHPHFAEAAAHIGERSGQEGGGWAIYNNLGGSAFLASFYTTTPVLWAVAIGLAATLGAATLAYVRPRPLARLLAALIVLITADLLRGPAASLLMGAPGPLALACALPLLGLLLARATPAALRAALIWFASAAVPIGFLLAQPRTHMHVIDIPAALIIGWGLGALSERAARRGLGWPRVALALAAAALLAMATPYAYAMFVRRAPEYQRSFPMAHLGAYLALSADRATEPIGGNGRLGYPAQDGWKTIGELYRRGVLSGPFASNQSIEVAAWYTRGLLRCGATPEYYLIAGALRNPAIPPDYSFFGTVKVEGQDQIRIYSRSRPARPPYAFNDADFRDDFDAQPLPALPPADKACAQG